VSAILSFSIINKQLQHVVSLLKLLVKVHNGLQSYIDKLMQGTVVRRLWVKVAACNEAASVESANDVVVAQW